MTHAFPDLPRCLHQTSNTTKAAAMITGMMPSAFTESGPNVIANLSISYSLPGYTAIMGEVEKACKAQVMRRQDLSRFALEKDSSGCGGVLSGLSTVITTIALFAILQSSTKLVRWATIIGCP